MDLIKFNTSHPEVGDFLHVLALGYPCSRTLTCLIVTAGLQSLSSSNRDRQTVPEG